MGKNRWENRVRENLDDYEQMPYQTHVLTCEQGEAFERRQAEPPRMPTEAERKVVSMFHSTVKR